MHVIRYLHLSSELRAFMCVCVRDWMAHCLRGSRIRAKSWMSWSLYMKIHHIFRIIFIISTEVHVRFNSQDTLITMNLWRQQKIELITTKKYDEWCIYVYRLRIYVYIIIIIIIYKHWLREASVLRTKKIYYLSQSNFEAKLLLFNFGHVILRALMASNHIHSYMCHKLTDCDNICKVTGPSPSPHRQETNICKTCTSNFHFKFLIKVRGKSSINQMASVLTPHSHVVDDCTTMWTFDSTNDSRIYHLCSGWGSVFVLCRPSCLTRWFDNRKHFIIWLDNFEWYVRASIFLALFHTYTGLTLFRQ